MTRSERDIIAAAIDGDQHAFAELVTPYRIRAWNVCLRICRNHHDAEDALQIALTMAWKNLDRFRGNSSFGTWFYRIASNASFALLRKRKDTVALDDEDAKENREVYLTDVTASSFDSQVVNSDALRTALDTLSDKAREAIVLYEIAGLKVAEVAEHQGSSLSATKVRLHRARKQLAEVLDR